MKKIAMMFLVVALAVALGACAFAEYVNKDGAKVYADWDTDSKVIARLSKGDKVTVLDVVDMQGKWNEVSIKVKGKKKTGFMLSKYLDENAPCKHKWGAWVIIDEPTCTETGLRQVDRHPGTNLHRKRQPHPQVPGVRPQGDAGDGQAAPRLR